MNFNLKSGLSTMGDIVLLCLPRLDFLTIVVSVGFIVFAVGIALIDIFVEGETKYDEMILFSLRA